jgi:hypothetical protein
MDMIEIGYSDWFIQVVQITYDVGDLLARMVSHGVCPSASLLGSYDSVAELVEFSDL